MVESSNSSAAGAVLWYRFSYSTGGTRPIRLWRRRWLLSVVCVMQVPAEEELAASLIADNRILLAVTPAKPPTEWSVVGVEA